MNGPTCRAQCCYFSERPSVPSAPLLRVFRGIRLVVVRTLILRFLEKYSSWYLRFGVQSVSRVHQGIPEHLTHTVFDLEKFLIFWGDTQKMLWVLRFCLSLCCRDM